MRAVFSGEPREALEHLALQLRRRLVEWRWWRRRRVLGIYRVD